MTPVNYLNIYIMAIFGVVGATLAGSWYFYSGMDHSSFLVSTINGTSRFYLDKFHFEFTLTGLIYCATFFAAALLFLLVIVIPSQDQVAKRMSMTMPYSAGSGMQIRQGAAPMQQMAPIQMQAPQASPAQMQAPQSAPQAAPAKGKAAPVLDDIVEEDDLVDEADSPAEDTGDADVVYGSGRITDEATVEYIHRHPDSAVKFLFRKTLDGKPLPPSEDEIYKQWQKRGLSRNKVREYILQIMEWDTVPDSPVNEIWSKLRDQIFELTH